MKVKIDGDMISLDHKYGIDIGPKPKNYGLECLRYDGNKIINLTKLNKIWVEKNGNKFILHCIDIGNCQLVDMTYNQRKNLINDNGTFRVKTANELGAEIEQNNEISKKACKRTKLRNQIGDRFVREEHMQDLVHLVLDVVINNDNKSKQILTQYIEKTQNIKLNSLKTDKFLSIAEKKDKIFNEDI